MKFLRWVSSQRSQGGAQRRQDHRQRPAGLEQREGPGRAAAAEQLEDLLQHAGRRAAGQLAGVAAHGLEGVGGDGEAEPGGEADGPERAHRVLAHAHLGIADGGHAAGLEVGPAVHVVDHLAGGRIVEEAVDGEVAPDGVLLGGAEDVVAGDEQVALLAGVLGEVGGVLPEGGHLDHLAAAEVDVGQPEAPADEPAVAEDGPHLARVGVGGEVEVLGLVVEQQVAHAAAHEVGLVAHVAQPVDDPQRVLVEPIDRDLRVVGRRRDGGIEREAGGRRAAGRVVVLFVVAGGALRGATVLFVHSFAGSGGRPCRGKSTGRNAPTPSGSFSGRGLTGCHAVSQCGAARRVVDGARGAPNRLAAARPGRPAAPRAPARSCAGGARRGRAAAGPRGAAGEPYPLCRAKP